VLTEWRRRDEDFCSKDSDPWCLFQTFHSHQNSDAAARLCSSSSYELICRRGDSNPHELPHTPLKRARLPVPPLRLVWAGCQINLGSGVCVSPSPRSNQTHHLFFFGAAAGELDEAGWATGAAAEGAACGVAVGVAVGVGVAAGCSGIPDCNTEVVPLMNGSERHIASSINPAAAPIVIFESNVCVPRGPKAVLDTELENRAPASALPGCSSTATIKMTHARMNSP
jgi:hypothetical protein